jgi:hypothetical protein
MVHFGQFVFQRRHGMTMTDSTPFSTNVYGRFLKKCTEERFWCCKPRKAVYDVGVDYEKQLPTQFDRNGLHPRNHPFRAVDVPD